VTTFGATAVSVRARSRAAVGALRGGRDALGTAWSGTGTIRVMAAFARVRDVEDVA
jgi:hypothetical protein